MTSRSCRPSSPSSTSTPAKCTYASAGHPPALHCAGGRATELGPTGPIVGPFDGPWTSATFTVERGDTLAIYTDGVIEARNADKEEFGVDRLRDLVCAASCDEAAAIAKRIIEDVTLFAPGRVHDDATIVLPLPRPSRLSDPPRVGLASQRDDGRSRRPRRDRAGRAGASGRRATPLELVDAAITRIEKLDHELNAVIHRRFDQAREEAAGDLPDGPFRGVPDRR